MKTLKIISAALVLALIVAGCEQSPWNSDELGDQLTMAEEEIASLKSAEATDSDVDAVKFAGHLMKGGMTLGGHHLLFGRNFPPCATVTVDSDEFPKTITVDLSTVTPHVAGPDNVKTKTSITEIDNKNIT